MAGYHGYSMSNNAVAAYENGEMPLTKWTKAAILEAVAEISEEKAELARQLTVAELRLYLLDNSSWHHTSCHYNRTNFYSLNPEKVEELTQKEIANIKRLRKPVVKRSAEEIAAEKEEKARRKVEKELKAEKEQLFKYQKKYKSLGGFMRSTTVNLDELRRIRLDKIAARREELRVAWTAQDFKRGLEKINDDEFIESYIR